MFINLEKTYENVPLIKLWKALEETGISHTPIATVKELYMKSLSYIKQGAPNKGSKRFTPSTYNDVCSVH